MAMQLKRTTSTTIVSGRALAAANLGKPAQEVCVDLFSCICQLLLRVVIQQTPPRGSMLLLCTWCFSELTAESYVQKSVRLGKLCPPLGGLQCCSPHFF